MDTKTLCLGALIMGDSSGYEIRKVFEEGPFSHFHASSFGSIYPALTKLLAEGLADCTEHAQDGKPDKKVYAITNAGRAAFLDALRKPMAPDKRRSEFMFALFFGHLLEEPRVHELIDDYLTCFQARAASMNSCNVDAFPAGHRFVYGFGQAMYKTATEYIEANRHILEGDEHSKQGTGS